MAQYNEHLAGGALHQFRAIPRQGTPKRWPGCRSVYQYQAEPCSPNCSFIGVHLRGPELLGAGMNRETVTVRCPEERRGGETPPAGLTGGLAFRGGPAKRRFANGFYMCGAAGGPAGFAKRAGQLCQEGRAGCAWLAACIDVASVTRPTGSKGGTAAALRRPALTDGRGNFCLDGCT